MDINPQRAAVAAARTANADDFNHAGADSGIVVSFAATLEVTNATIAIYNEDSGHAVELTQRFARAKAFTHVLLLKSPQAIQPTIDEQKLCSWCASRRISRVISTTIKPPRYSYCSTGVTPTARKSPLTIYSRLLKLSAGSAAGQSETEQQRTGGAQLVQPESRL